MTSLAVIAIRIASQTMRDERGRAVASVTATAAKNGFGAVLEAALSRGVVAITKRGTVRAVVLSVERYEALVNSSSRLLAGLESEFDALVASMRTPRARRAGDALFAAKPAALGKAAVGAARKRG